MANVKTYDLVQCSRMYPTIEGANNSLFSTYVNAIVRINNDDSQSYTVRENVQARFFAPTSADGVSDVEYSVTSILYNGNEQLLAPETIVVQQANNDYIEFPLYNANPTLYTANLANAVTTADSAVPTAFFERNFITFVQGIFDTLEIPVEIINSHPNWWALEAFLFMNNFMIEMHSSDTLEIVMTETYNAVSRIMTYRVNGTSATALINGVDVTVIPVPADEQPQFGDVYSIHSYAIESDPIQAIACCPIVSPFVASLSTGSCSSLDMNCDCNVISFSDESNYDNGLIGHDPEFFNHRTITLYKPDGTTYVWGTEGDVDEIITPHYNSSNNFSYTMLPSDTDGIYSVKICTYPDWQSDVNYASVLNHRVYRNGLIYQQVSSSYGVDPELDIDNEFWEVVPEEAIGCGCGCNSSGGCSTVDTGRYCSTEYMVVLCVNIMDCYKRLVEKSMCDLKNSPCKSVCDNKDFMNAMKMRVTFDALDYAVCAELWDLAKDHVAILKSICCCNG